jgi:hypothetical protein
MIDINTSTIKNLVNEVQNRIPIYELPSQLYHYCNVESFYKIIDSKTFHLSNVNYANDYAEIK